MPSTSIIDRLRGERSTLADRFAEAIVVEGGRRDGSAETRVTIDLRHPELADDGGSGGPERWRLRTARHRLARAPFSRDVLAAFHDAEAQKGRRLTAVDLRNQNRVAALMAWHFEPRTRQGGSRRPHLVTALSIGVVLDAAIALKQVELADLGFRRGRRRDGYKGVYYELAA